MKNAKKTFPIPQLDKEWGTTVGYPDYPVSEAIYNRLKEEKSGKGLGVPGSEMDYEQTGIRSEDEANHYYNLCGNRLDNLDEN